MEKFDITTLFENFQNLEVKDKEEVHESLVRYSVYGPGGYKGDISYFKKEPKEIRIYVDNYPGQKKFYATNIPFESLEEFVNKMKYLGLDLIYNAKENV